MFVRWRDSLCGFEGPRRCAVLTSCGGFSEGDTPLPIPNRAVKPLSADGTWPSRAWESRSPPAYTQKGAGPRPAPFVVSPVPKLAIAAGWRAESGTAAAGAGFGPAAAVGRD